MKKHLLSLSMGVAACAIAGAAFAGNNEAYTSQSGNGGAVNTITLYQNDNGGSDSYSTSGTGGYNKIGTSTDNAVRQIGAGNQLFISQTGKQNTFGADGSYQNGNGNSAYAVQAGFDSRVDLRQNGDNNGVSSGSNSRSIGYTNYINQSTDEGLGNNRIGLTQSGSNNEFNLQQIGGYNNSQTVYQNGYANQAAAYQGFGTNGSSISISQDGGNNNYASMTQIGATGDTGTTYTAMNPSRIVVNQNGSNNAATGTQSGFNNTMTIGQTGSSNFVSATQDAATQRAEMTINQYNNSNIAYLTQSGVTGASYIRASQNGGDTLNATQSGFNNTIDSNQYGTASFATLTQAGSNNKQNLTQYGYSNTATLSQDAATSNSQITLIQYDHNNTASLYQVGATNSTIYGTQSGANNTANVTQAGATQTMNFVQNGNNNLVTARQH